MIDIDEAIREPSLRGRPRPARLWASLVLAAALGLGLVVDDRASRADPIDPSVPATLTVGAPPGPAPGARLDGRRTGLARTAFPSAPAEVWRRSLGTLEVPPLVDDAGDVTVALASAEIVKLGAGGKEVWRARMQGGGPASAPVRLSDGSVAVVSTGGFFVGVSPRGKVRFSTQLGARGPDLVAPPIALTNGGAALVAGRSLYTLDGDGSIATETALPAHVSTSPVVVKDGILVVGDDGSVVRVSPPKQPQKVGSFVGMIDGGAVLADDRTLLGVMRDRLLALDLRTGIVSVRASTGSYAIIEGPVTVSSDGAALFTTSEGLLFGVDRTGQEVLRATVERVTPPPQPAVFPPPGAYTPPGYAPPPMYGQPTRQTPPLVVDPSGRVAFLRAGGRFGVSGVPAGRARRDATDASRGPLDSATVPIDVVSERACTTPLAVLPGGEGKLVVACREGLVAMFGDGG